VVLTPQAGIRLGPEEPFAEFLERRVTIVSLEALSRRQGLEPLEELLTLVVRPEAELGPTSRRLVAIKPELAAMIAPILWKRLPHLSLEEIMTIAGVQLAELSETRAYQDILAMGRQGWLPASLRWALPGSARRHPNDPPCCGSSSRCFTAAAGPSGRVRPTTWASQTNGSPKKIRCLPLPRDPGELPEPESW